MSSRLKVLSITGLKEAGWSEKCGNTLSEKALTKSALYCEEKCKVRVRQTCTYKRYVQMSYYGILQSALDVSQPVHMQR